jgi:hypothetical protein
VTLLEFSKLDNGPEQDTDDRQACMTTLDYDRLLPLLDTSAKGRSLGELLKLMDEIPSRTCSFGQVWYFNFYTAGVQLCYDSTMDKIFSITLFREGFHNNGSKRFEQFQGRLPFDAVFRDIAVNVQQKARMCPTDRRRGVSRVKIHDNENAKSESGIQFEVRNIESETYCVLPYEFSFLFCDELAGQLTTVLLGKK